MTKVVGLDVSVAGTGAVSLTYTGEWSVFGRRMKTAKDGGDLGLLLDRMRYVRDECGELAKGANLVVIEEQAFAASGNAARSLAGVWYFVADRLLRMEIPIVRVSTSSLKKYATGSGRPGAGQGPGAAKREVSRAVARMWPDIDAGSGDADDAMVLASIGAHMLSLPVPYPLTAYRVEVVGKLTLPDGLAA